jgi:hypothetical protein
MRPKIQTRYSGHLFSCLTDPEQNVTKQMAFPTMWREREWLQSITSYLVSCFHTGLTTKDCWVVVILSSHKTWAWGIIVIVQLLAIINKQIVIIIRKSFTIGYWAIGWLQTKYNWLLRNCWVILWVFIELLRNCCWPYFRRDIELLQLAIKQLLVGHYH